MLPRLRRTLEDLAAVDSTPRRTATALALGVGLSFSPLLGLQILIGVGAALAFRLSRVAVLIGLCANVPWIMLPWYGLTTAGAATLLGTSSDVDLGERLRRILSVPFYQAAFWGHARRSARRVLLAVSHRANRRGPGARRSGLHRGVAGADESRGSHRGGDASGALSSCARRRGASCRWACPRRAGRGPRCAVAGSAAR